MMRGRKVLEAVKSCQEVVEGEMIVLVKKQHNPPKTSHYLKIRRAIYGASNSKVRILKVCIILLLPFIIVKYMKTIQELPAISSGMKKPLVCTSDIAQQSYDEQAGLADERQIQKVKEAEALVAYIVEKLDAINAPVLLAFGSLLYEYRNNTDANPCINYRVTDKDLDIGLMERHFHIVSDMRYEIAERFDWDVEGLNSKKMILFLTPRDQNKTLGAGFQVDVYGFKTNYPEKGLVYFPWEDATYGMDSMMPLVKHKTIAYHGQDDGRKKDLYLYKPFNTSCYLENFYGSDFMTPHLTKGYFMRKQAFGHPTCENKKMSEYEVAELERQLHKNK
eukprot:CAMPEP_0178954590 /NCGR_PEP_ID=MMETSP0789-20121207/9081_1 /TAXON_ID=3005 /ORGANISM="Rhizosolenia setigera, Strain CCMP 1694" /LENGTH=333 /DNA_ID=CAMNT_0020636021 /DNA_START=50 /DNA_END=1051 /DNA_ORIENTATION=+